MFFFEYYIIWIRELYILLSYRKTREQPTESAEYKCFNQSNDVQKLPSFNAYTIACEKYGDRAIDCDA